MLKWRHIAATQGAFYLATGLWPLAHRRSFEAVTGPKVDWWLVQTVGVLVTAAGASLMASTMEDKSSRGAMLLLGGLSAAGLAAIEVKEVSKRRIHPVYLVDALVELSLSAAWLISSRNSQVKRRELGAPKVAIQGDKFP